MNRGCPLRIEIETPSCFKLPNAELSELRQKKLLMAHSISDDVEVQAGPGRHPTRPPTGGRAAYLHCLLAGS